MEDTVSRGDIRDKLIKWKLGDIAEEELRAWAEDLYDNNAFTANSTGDDAEDPVLPEVLQYLGSLDMNLVLIEDIPIFIEFLNSDKKDFDAACEKFHKCLEQIDYNARRNLLKLHKFYKMYTG